MQTALTRQSSSAAKATTKPIQDKLADYLGEIQRLQETNQYLLRRLAKSEELANHLRGDRDTPVWFWRGNGNDPIDSMSSDMPVLITAAELRLVKAEARRLPEGLQHKLTALAQAVHFYAAQASYKSSWQTGDATHAMEDRGRVARNALVFAEKGVGV